MKRLALCTYEKELVSMTDIWLLVKEKGGGGIYSIYSKLGRMSPNSFSKLIDESTVSHQISLPERDSDILYIRRCIHTWLDSPEEGHHLKYAPAGFEISRINPWYSLTSDRLLSSFSLDMKPLLCPLAPRLCLSFVDGFRIGWNLSVRG